MLDLLTYVPEVQEDTRAKEGKTPVAEGALDSASRGAIYHLGLPRE